MRDSSGKLNAAQAGIMLKLQDQLNCVINPDWIHGGANFLRAAFVESAEALEHYGWKWWKKQSIDLPQVQIELVDILHFYLSQTLVTHSGSVEAASGAIVLDLNGPDEVTLDGKKYQLGELNVPELLELIGALAVCRRFSFKVLEAAMRGCAMSWADAFGQYVSKNVLNIFRQENGYKEGTYIKTWSGEEDNVSLARLMSSMDLRASNLAEDLYTKLCEEYSRVAQRVSP